MCNEWDYTITLLIQGYSAIMHEISKKIITQHIIIKLKYEYIKKINLNKLIKYC